MDVTTGNQPDTVIPTSTEDRSDREGLIRDLYALAAFYVAHPHHPLPDSISVYHYVDTAGEVDRIAGEYTQRPAYRRVDDGRQIDFELPGPKSRILLCTAWLDR